MLPVAGSEARRALDDIKKVRRRIHAFRRTDWPAILETVEPYRDVDALSGAGPKESGSLLALLNAVRGDAYRELEHPRLAAEAYCRAVRFRADCGCTDFYASLVLKHRLTDHYETALYGLLDADREWKRRPIGLRVLAGALSLLTDPPTFLHFVRSRFLQPRWIRELSEPADTGR